MELHIELSGSETRDRKNIARKALGNLDRVIELRIV